MFRAGAVPHVKTGCPAAKTVPIDGRTKKAAIVAEVTMCFIATHSLSSSLNTSGLEKGACLDVGRSSIVYVLRLHSFQVSHKIYLGFAVLKICRCDVSIQVPISASVNEDPNREKISPPSPI